MALQDVKEALRSSLPDPVFDALKHAYNYCKPARTQTIQTTIYINTPSCRTYIGLNNFYSWLGADHIANAHARITFYDPAGDVILTVKRSLGFFGSCMLDVRALLLEHHVSADFGIFTVTVKPDNPWNAAAKKMGDSTAIFYCFYQDDNGSIALIHPNARIGDVTPSYNWRSLQVISTQNLAAIVLYQMHGGDYEHETTYRLTALDTGEELAARTIKYKAFGSARIEFRIEDLRNVPAEIALKADALPSSNAKPLLQRVFKSGLFSISHS